MTETSWLWEGMVSWRFFFVELSEVGKCFAESSHVDDSNFVFLSRSTLADWVFRSDFCVKKTPYFPFVCIPEVGLFNPLFSCLVDTHLLRPFEKVRIWDLAERQSTTPMAAPMLVVQNPSQFSTTTLISTSRFVDPYVEGLC